MNKFDTTPDDPSQYKYSVVIPVYNSETIIEKTVARTVDFFENMNWSYEIILVNDGSPDNSWATIRSLAETQQNLIVIDLLRNYGQHTAIYAGLHHMTGDFLITMDDDLQNPPEEIEVLVKRILEGYDVVYGKFKEKKHSRFRNQGSRIIYWFNKHIFDIPPDLTVSNYRIMRRDVVERIKSYRTSFPYMTGLSLMFSQRKADVPVEHLPRKEGESNYNLIRIAKLVLRILFSYSTFPLRLISFIGFISATGAFLIGIFILLWATTVGTSVPGWASTIIAISFFSGINTVIVSMLGEYVLRLLQQSSTTQLFHVRSLYQSTDKPSQQNES